MTGKSKKDKKLILVSNSVVNELMLIANKQGKPFYGFVTETLEHALKVYADGHSLEEVVSFYELMEIFKSLGAKMISDDMFNYLIVKYLYFYLFMCTIKTEISEGETPEMREACPNVRGFIFRSFSLASFDKESNLV